MFSAGKIYGWNNLAYVNNEITIGIDRLGLAWNSIDMLVYYYRISGPDWIDTDVMGLAGAICMLAYCVKQGKKQEQVASDERSS